MKKAIALLGFMVVLLAPLFALGHPEKSVTVGVAIYRFDDTFMTGVRTAIVTAGSARAIVRVVDSKNSQTVQNESIDGFIADRVDVLAINPVDRTSAGVLIDKARKAGIPVVFFNREPLTEDLRTWDRVYYVGAKAEESGTMSGQIIADYWKAHPEADKNHDGILQYVMIKGEPGHQDTELRTEYAIRCLADNGIRVQKLAEDSAYWDRIQGQETMIGFIAAYGDAIEAVFSNNDDMALGAIEALKAAGYFRGGRYLPVVGVDATAPAMQALQEGTLLGTVVNDAENQGRAVFNLAYDLARGRTPTSAGTGYDITDGQYVWIPYRPVTHESREPQR